MADRDRVTFTRGAAERIANAVRKVEVGERGGGQLEFENRGQQGFGRKTFRMCTFTGSWSIGSAKTVTFKYQTATPNTVVATNLFAEIGTASSSRNCAIAKEGTAWFLIAAEC